MSQHRNLQQEYQDNMAVYEIAFNNVIANYRRRWWRWYFDPSWQTLAFMDAHAAADRAYQRTRRMW